MGVYDELEALWKRAEQNYLEKQYSEATTSLTELITYLKNELIEAHERRALVYSDLEETDLYLADLNSLIEYLPDDIRYYKIRANILMKRGDIASALIDYDKVIQLNNTDTNARVKRSYIYTVMERYKEAIDDLTVILLNNEHSALMANTYLLRGNIYFLLGNYKQALDDFNDALNSLISEDENSTLKASIYHSRGHLYFSLGEENYALHDFNKALNLQKHQLVNSSVEYVKQFPFSVQNYNG